MILFSVSETNIKTEQDFKIKYNMYRYWNAVSVGYTKYYPTVMRPITLCTIHL